MASRVKVAGTGSSSKKKKHNNKSKRNLNNPAVLVQHNSVRKAKRSVQRRQKKWKRNLLNVQMSDFCNVGGVKKRGFKRRNTNNSFVVAKDETVTESVILCDSDSDCDVDKDIIEIHDSVSETFTSETNSNKRKEDEIIVLDDSQSEVESTSSKSMPQDVTAPKKRLRLDEPKQSTVPNSIVVVVSNTPQKKDTAKEIEIIEVEESPAKTIGNTSQPSTGSNENSTGRSESQTSDAASSTTTTNTNNNPPKIPEQCDFIPLQMPPCLVPVTKAQMNSMLTLFPFPSINQARPMRTPRTIETKKCIEESLQNIKITVRGSDRMFQKSATNVRAQKKNISSSAALSTATVTTNSLPKIAVGSAFGGNLYNAGQLRREGLRDVVIDGSNVAIGHSNGKFFSVKGLKICIDYFLQRGHKVRAFVPHYRTKYGHSSHPTLLRQLHEEGHVVLTPSREVNGKKFACYDDRLLVQCAAELEAVVVSGDNYRDLLRENPTLKDTIEKRLLIPTWVDDMIIFPSDPLGRHGPSLERFLRFP